MIELEKRSALDNKPLTWNYLQLPSGQISATIICSNGHYGSLAGHIIKADGIVQPSVLCVPDPPSLPEGRRCDFHEMVKLLDWDKGEYHP